MKKKILSFFTKGHARTIRAKKNIMISLTINAISMFIMFAMVSLSIDYLGKEAYGLWILLAGIQVWTNLFDFGLTNGLRNKLSESLASKEDTTRIQKSMVSTTYAIMFNIAAISFVVIEIVIYLINWKDLFHIDFLNNQEIQILLLIIFFTFSINLFLKPINAILNAMQWSSIGSLFSLTGSIFSLVFLLVLLNIEVENRLLTYVLILSFTPVAVFMFASLFLFNSKLKKFKPTLKDIDFKLGKKMTSLGYSFFVIQLAGLIIAQTDNLLIAILFGTEEVADYNIVFRYFSIFIISTSILLTPFWSGFTEAYVKKDFLWIKKVVNKLLLLFSFLIIIVNLFIIYSDNVYKLWINENITIPHSLSIAMGVYVIVYSFSNIFIYFVNGISAIRLQMYIGSFMAILNIPLSYLFSSTLNYGVTGIIMATTICAAIPGIVSYFQYQKIINQTAHGIWIK